MERRYIRSKEGRYPSCLFSCGYIKHLQVCTWNKQTNKQTGEPFGSLRVFIWLGKKRRGWMFIARQTETETHSHSVSAPLRPLPSSTMKQWTRKEFVAVTDRLPSPLCAFFWERNTHTTDRVLFTFCSVLFLFTTDRDRDRHGHFSVYSDDETRTVVLCLLLLFLLCSRVYCNRFYYYYYYILNWTDTALSCIVLLRETTSHLTHHMSLITTTEQIAFRPFLHRKRERKAGYRRRLPLPNVRRLKRAAAEWNEWGRTVCVCEVHYIRMFMNIYICTCTSLGAVVIFL